MQKQNIKDLLLRYKSGDCTEEERALVENWYLNWEEGSFDLSEHEFLDDLALIKKDLPKPKKWNIFYYRVAAAAVAMITLSVAFHFIFNPNSGSDKNDMVARQQPAKIIPGSNKAILTLADGSTVVLDGNAQVDSINQFGVKISKSADGKLAYSKGKGSKVSDVYNTLTVPRGGHYNVILPDGTKVWLNAASKLRFPIAFNGRERKVELSGEAYFEVFENKAKPFKVVCDYQEITVLGTHFNVNAYEDESFIKTTLLEGKVRITKDSEHAVLTPGEQSVTSESSSSIKLLKDIDVQESIAWKNGLFVFEKESIYSIMNKISRWYDIEVEYRGNLKGKEYSGNISKFEEVKEVIKTMELTGTIQFKFEGRRVIVMP